MPMTITEALAELKTIEKRIAKKQEFVNQYLLRQEMFKDPLEKDGGSVTAIQREMQTVADLQERHVAIRRAISAVNARESVGVNGTTRTIADWLVWRREVAPKVTAFFQGLSSRISSTRADALKKGLGVVAGNADAKPTDVVVNVSEQDLAKRLEDLEGVLGVLDGQLSLKNATLTIDV